MVGPDELIELLGHRHEILRSLRDEPKERYVLVDDLDASKSTVYKGVSQLQDAGLIVSTSRGLRPTQFGVVALERYDELASTTELGPMLAELPPGTVEPQAVRGAEAIVPDRQSVDRHLARLERLFQEADSIRGFSPAVSPEQSAIFHDRTVDDQLAAELILPTELVGHLHKRDPTGLEETLAAEAVTFFHTDQPLRITLFLAEADGETEVCIAVGEAGLTTGLIVNETPESRRWAEREFERVKQTAERVTPDVLPLA